MDTSPPPSEQQRHDAPAATDFLRNGGTVYTAITEGYDAKPLCWPGEDGVARVVRLGPKGSDGRLWNREEKLMLPPKSGLWSLYLDGSLSPKGPLRDQMVEWLDEHDVALFKHPHRTCAYAEIDACVARKKITPEQGEQARGTLLLSGFPRDFGLWALGMIARRVHANSMQHFIFPMCWEMTKHITRDQIWFPFVMWKIRSSLRRLRTIDADIFDNRHFVFRSHA